MDVKPDTFVIDQEPSTKEKLIASNVKMQGVIDLSTYEVDDSFKPANDLSDIHQIHTTAELIAHLEKHKDTEVEARVLCLSRTTEGAKLTPKKFSRDKLIESYKNPKKFTFKEGSIDAFGMDLDQSSGGFVGEDSIPLLGGPFSKQMYYYDYLKMHATAFHAYHHDPMARQAVTIMRDFTLGRGFKVDSEDRNALALWDAFAEVNDLYALMDQAAIELSIYGEIMLWELPNNQTKISYMPTPGQKVPTGLLPRFRLIDPSVIWEIVTYPEDITRVLYYQWVAPTQYQMYNGMDQGKSVPGSKFIFQQIPADQVMHYKINCVSNEKRGRSDLFPILGYLKRLRDSVNYQIIALQKASAWGIDTTIRGTQSDMQDYIKDLSNQKFAQAGSEFVHTDAIKREYLGLSGGHGGNSEAFKWTFSMICAGLGIPESYFGTHISGGSTRASALVATEPVAKKFEMRQWQFERVLKALWKRVINRVYPDAECEVTFPEIIVQDRSAKLKDLALAESQGWIAPSTAATIAGKELQITSFDFDDEHAKIEKEKSEGITAPAPLSAGGLQQVAQDSTSAVTKDDRKGASDSYGYQ